MRQLLEDLTPHSFCPIKANKLSKPEARERVEPQMRQILNLSPHSGARAARKAVEQVLRGRGVSLLALLVKTNWTSVHIYLRSRSPKGCRGSTAEAHALVA